MKLEITYSIPTKDLSVFSHLESNHLSVTVNTDILDDLDDLKCRIIHEILSVYNICIHNFDEYCVKDWPTVKKTVLARIYERKWNDACERVRYYTEMRDKTVEQLNELVAEANREADERKEEWLRIDDATKI